MHGIYDFENHYTPQLSMDMLMERKAKKHARKMYILSGIAALLMAILVIILLCLVAETSKMLFMISCGIVCVYVIAGGLFIGNVIKKKGDYTWERQ